MREAVTRARTGQGVGAGKPGPEDAPTGRHRWAAPSAPGSGAAARGDGWAASARTQRPGGTPRLDATSPLALGSHLLGLARDADRAGLTGLAEQLLALACAVLDQPPVAFA